MPLLHCNSCHHEWEGRLNSKCDWCGDSGNVLEEKTSLERFMEGDLKGFIERWKKERLNIKPEPIFGETIRGAIRIVRDFKARRKKD